MTNLDRCIAIACCLTVLLFSAALIYAVTKEDDHSDVRAAQIIAEAIKQPVKCEE